MAVDRAASELEASTIMGCGVLAMAALVMGDDYDVSPDASALEQYLLARCCARQTAGRV